MRKLLLLPAVLAAAVIPALALTAPSADPLKYHDGRVMLTADLIPRVQVNSQYQVQNGQNGLFVHAHAVNSAVQDLATGVQSFVVKDAISWVSNHDGTVTTVKYALVGNSGYCLDWHSNSGLVYLDPCDSGFADGSQQWWVPPVNALLDWIINADASAHTPNPPHDYRFMTDRPLAGDFLYADPPGNGLYAEWVDSCVANC